MRYEVNILDACKIRCEKNWSWDSDNNNWEGYHFWYVYSGTVSISTANKHYSLKANDVFLFDLKNNHICRHDPLNPLCVYTIYFQSPTLLSSHVSQKLIENCALLGKMIEYIVEKYENKAMTNINIWLEAVLSEFTNKVVNPNGKHPVVRAIDELLEKRRNSMLMLGELCDEIGYSKNHLIRLVKKETGYTPIRYQMNYKMDYAKSLLLYSDEPIVSVSEQVGFLDANYFTKVFKEYVGVSPSRLRSSTNTTELINGRTD